MAGKNVIHMLKNASSIQMESFVIETCDGNIIVVDGGMKADADHLLEKLREISGKTVPHVTAWFFTHAHLDHMDAFLELLARVPVPVTFDRIYCCFPSEQYLALEQDPNGGATTLRRFNRQLDRLGSRVTTVSAGDVYVFGAARVEILRTVDCTIRENVVNNSSVVFKLYLGEKTMLFLGDLGLEGGAALLAQKREALKVDYCQMAHHGQHGVDEAFYRAVAPEACFWCAPDWLWDNDAGEGFNTSIFATVETRSWMEKLGVKTHYVIKDGDHAVVC